MRWPERHDRVWLRPDWPQWLRTPLPPAEAAALGDWLGAGLPLAGARKAPHDAADTVRLGLTLPGRRRLGVALGHAALARIAPPLTLAEVLDSAPVSWRARARAVLDLAGFCGAGVQVHVYGSLSWQHLSGTAYVTPDSDLDLLLCIDGSGRSNGDILSLLAGLTALEGGTPRLDGELRLPDGSDVAWRELAARPPKLLVRSRSTLGFRPLAELLAPA